jgi:PAS domain S-box-containing protein
VLADAIAQARIEGAESSDHAMIIGDQTGIVEWANAAWSQITGIPPCETLQKPITHFLEVAEINLELVDFVAQHFLAGRTCMVEFPFETFDQHEIQVHLEVRPIRRAAGELDGFLAVARIGPAHDVGGSALSLRSAR